MSDIGSLTPWLTPPEEGGEELTWESTEREWNLQFPSDYKRFVEVYGPGSVAKSLSIAAPLSEGHPVYFSGYRLTPLSTDTLEMLESPYPAHPAVGGLLGIGGTPNGDAMLYRTASLMEDWHVVTWSRGGRTSEEQWIDHGMGFVDFLLALLTGRLANNPFGEFNSARTVPLTYHSWRTGY